MASSSSGPRLGTSSIPSEFSRLLPAAGGSGGDSRQLSYSDLRFLTDYEVGGGTLPGVDDSDVLDSSDADSFFGLGPGPSPQEKAALEERVRNERTREQLVWLRNSGLFLLVAGVFLLLTNVIASRSRAGDGIFTSTGKAKSSSSTSKSTSWARSTNTKPNIIFMLADDLGYNSLQYMDSTDLKHSTPFLTEMAKKGIKLTNYYAMEVCTPSRASLLTGRYPLTVGMQFNDVTLSGEWALNDTETLMPEVLQGEGYSTYMLGKWNLGHFSPRFLPTARGFDYFLGFLSGETYYWSKLCPQQTGVVDLMYADSNCYYGYDGGDMHEYSTFLYRDKAVKVIRNHDFDSKPLFMYLSFQGVHDPYHDHNQFTNGIPKDYLTDTVYNAIHTGVVGRERRQYAMSLALMDDAVKRVVKSLKQVDQLDNTILIWTSDNGGCVLTGGRNGDLRGSKGTLFEGGTKVDAFIYSPLLDEDLRGTSYSPVMHVSDWMPTLLEMAGIDYTPDSSKEFDGVSHSSNLLLGDEAVEVRSSMLYNIYTSIDGLTKNGDAWNMMSNAPLAIRSSQYKLIHAYDDGGTFSGWYSQDEKSSDDDSTLTISASCSQTDTLIGNYTMYLFDLINDPNETVNLYDNDSYADVKSDFYSELVKFAKLSREDYTTFDESSTALPAFVSANGYVVPWVTGESSGTQGTRDYWPNYCRSSSLLAPSTNDDYYGEFDQAAEDDDVALIGDDDDETLVRNDDLTDTSPTIKPSKIPSPVPSRSPNYTPEPTQVPSASPTGPTLEPTANAPQSLPTYRPSASKTTHEPTPSSDTTAIDALLAPTAPPSLPVEKPSFKPTPSPKTPNPTPSISEKTSPPTMPSVPTEKPSPTPPTVPPSLPVIDTAKPSAEPVALPTPAPPTVPPSLPVIDTAKPSSSDLVSRGASKPAKANKKSDKKNKGSNHKDV